MKRGIGRREALKGMGAIAGAAAARGLLPGLPGCGGSEDGPPPTFVAMMLENRTYDHMFGARSMLEGLPGDGLLPAMANLDRLGASVPIWEATTDTLCALDPPHGWDSAHLQWNAGANDGFLTTHQDRHGTTSAIEPMQYLTRAHAPISWALADAYTSCDRWFAALMGPTWPNRMYWYTGTAEGAMSNNVPTGGLAWPTLFNRLSDKGVDWRYYFGNLPAVAAWDQIGNDDRVDYLENFFKAAKNGTLPPVVYLDPIFFENDDHPPLHPVFAQALIASVYRALAESPQWENCTFVITYDEHGGFFDHVSPPTTTDDLAAQGFDQLGFRVPALVMGPYAKAGHVSSVVRNHASVLRHLELAFDLEPLTARTQAAADLSECFDLDRLAAGEAHDPIELPAITTDIPLGASCAAPANLTDAMRLDHPMIEWAERRTTGRHLDWRGNGQRASAAIEDFLKTDRSRVH